ncbi:hypothetical protein FACS189490_10150 [Clostridia bacterium]|nr:hypothetical protein FACS189490_10150 [Clostridia bacterium]
MKEERLRILKLIEDGKISADEAVKLLEAIGAPGNGIPDGPTVDERFREFSQNAEAFLKDVGGKFGELYKEAEPKLKKAAKTVVEKTAYVVEEIAKNLNESLKNFKEEDGESCGCGCAHEEEKDDEPKEN